LKAFEKPKLAIIVPCYNEEEILPYTINKLTELLSILKKEGIISTSSFICFVDDGSIDKSWNLLEEGLKANRLLAIKLSSNFGHQNALMAGLNENRNGADIFVTIDCDLQDDVRVIKKMVLSYLKGNQVVYGVRDSRTSDTFFKRFSAILFYKFQSKLGVNIIGNHADFRLISQDVLLHLQKFNEVNLFLRAIFPLMGFKNEKIYYDRSARLAGETKYPLKKMISFAWEGITSFSVVPLRIITILGGLIFIISMIFGIYFLYLKIFTNGLLPGWASTVIPIYFIGGIQLLCTGIIGEYIGKIYKETKGRPRYLIEKSYKWKK
jgi:polyisoprenyl-phosphate glycosyltransferase